MLSVLTMTLAAASCSQSPSSVPVLRRAVGQKVYDESADARADLGKAVTRARLERKRLLVVFGGNWCSDCIALDRRLHEPPAASIMDASYILVHVDIGQGDKNKDVVKQCGVSLAKGVPAVAVLDSDGSVLYSARDGEFEPAQRLKPQVFVDFLNEWKSAAPR